MEFTVSSFGVVLAVTAAAWVLQTEWQRARCAYQVFEGTHSKLVGYPGYLWQNHVLVIERSDSFEGEGHCGLSQEHVELKKLEADP